MDAFMNPLRSRIPLIVIMSHFLLDPLSVPTVVHCLHAPLPSSSSLFPFLLGLLNVRGGDVKYNPVTLAYCLVTQTQATL